ncbi:protein RRP5 homolog [Drosophila miranda]|uniref:protein RRP5 homolog n=1 Tax=Drosophila miranda TaxID=7229 RepID=UPI0007E8A564|nr:protein RRP5 homolog [Drosophila miranda]
MVPYEKSFPRGGIVHAEAKSANANIIFGATQKKAKKGQQSKAKDSFLKELTEEYNDQLESASAETLRLDTLQEDMLVMGVVKESSAISLQIAIPGRMTARTQVGEISETYTRVAQSAMAGETSDYHDLTELFPVGTIVYGKAIKTDKPGSNRTSVLLSLKPADVHERLHHKNIKKGFVFSGAISEALEHGYVIETGIQGLTAFVACEAAEQTLHVGQLAFLKVKQVKHDASTSSCTCVHVQQDALKIKSQNESNLDYILPGSIVRFKLSKQLKDGLKGSIMNESFTAYVNEHHLANALETPEDYELNEEYHARVLYVMPLTKLVYLTLNLDIKQRAEDVEEQEEEPLKPGSIVEKAKVLRLGSGGVVLLLNKKLKAILSYGSIKANFKGNYDKDEVLSKYGRKTKHKVRVLGYDMIESLYYCSDDPNLVNEKLYSLEDLNPGDIVTAKMIKKDEKINGWTVKIGRLNGIIDQLYLANNLRYEVGQRVRCRVLDISLDRKTCYLSNRSEYLRKDAKLLTSLSAAQEGGVYLGTVVRCEPGYILVKFGDGIKGVLHRQNLSEKSSLSFFEGQTTTFRILSRNKDQITLTLPEDKFQLGEICPVEITNALDAGLEMKITYPADEDEDADQDDEQEPKIEEFLGLIPSSLLSDHVELIAAQKRIHPVGSHTEAACIGQNIFSLRDVPYFSGQLTKDWKTVQVGDIVRAYVKNVSTDQVVDLMVAIRDYNKVVKVHVKMLRLNAVRALPVDLTPDQLLYVKVLSKSVETKTLTVSAKLTDVWSGDLGETAKLVESYFDELMQIRSVLKEKSAPIAKFDLGKTISVIFKGIDPVSNDWLYTVEGSPKVKALLVSSLAPAGSAVTPQVGSKQLAVILWIDYAEDLLLVSTKKVDIEHIKTQWLIPSNFIGKTGMKAKVLLKLDSVIVCSLKKGVNPLVICPVRLHANDVENSGSAGLRPGDFCNIGFIHEELPIAVPETVWRLWKGTKRAATTTAEETLGPVKAKKAKIEAAPVKSKQEKIEAAPSKSKKAKAEPTPTKRKAEEAVQPQPPSNGQKKIESLTNGISKKQKGQFFEDKTPAKSAKANAETAKGNATQHEAAKARMPGVANFWESDLNQTKDASSDEEEDEPTTAETQTNSNKKKRLSAKEKAKAEVKEDQRLREIEERNADPQARLETIDQYERLVIAQPNNSMAWLKYISFLLSNTEIEKARDLARRSIATISFREPQELRNIWSALLSMELAYGNNFDEVLKEALQSNDPLETYISVVDILKKNNQRERLASVLVILLKKFKSEPKVWRLVAEAYFWLGKSDQVHSLLQRALRSLPNPEHINLIVAFAKLYENNDDKDMAQTLLDDIVTSYPKRIDIWSVYVDMLIKTGQIDSARNVLDRAVQQKLKPEKMRVIYKKYLKLEKKHGSKATEAKVMQEAEEWVKNFTKSI